MKSLIIPYVLLSALAVIELAEPKPDSGKTARNRNNLIDLHDLDNEQENTIIDSSKSENVATGRLFFRRLFKKRFNQNQKPQIIPIIITGTTGITDTTIDTPIDTNTDPDTNINTDIDTNTDPDDSTDATDTSTVTRLHLYGRGSINESIEDTNYALADEETLNAVAVPGAKQYVVTAEEIEGNSYSKGYHRTPTHINLRVRGAHVGEVINVLIPSKYKSSFSNGQHVVLSPKRNRPAAHPINKKRTNRRRANKNRNKRRRIITA